MQVRGYWVYWIVEEPIRQVCKRMPDNREKVLAPSGGYQGR